MTDASQTASEPTASRSPLPEEHASAASARLEGITMFGAQWCRDCRRTKAQLDELGVPYRYVDLEAEPDAAEVARDISGRTQIPVVVYPDATHHVEPTNADVEAKLRELAIF